MRTNEGTDFNYLYTYRKANDPCNMKMAWQLKLNGAQGSAPPCVWRIFINPGKVLHKPRKSKFLNT